MKISMFLFTMALTSLVFYETSATPAGLFSGEPQKVKLKVTGMSCGGCANHISKALGELEGILEEDVQFPGDVAIVKFDPDKVTLAGIIKTIEEAGYKAEVMKENKPKDTKKTDNGH